MEGFNKCKNGHYYKKELSVCPYCPSNNSDDGDKTEYYKKTKEYQDNTGPDSDTKNTVETKKTEVYKSATKKEPVITQQTDDGNRTIIHRTSTSKEGKEIQMPVSGRKLVGWLVTYTIDPMGVDFRLYEGRNTMGRNTKNDIRTVQDDSISGEHAVILFREDKFYIEDLMSTTGTKINNKSLGPREVVELIDGDSIIMGKSIFKFKNSL